MMEFTFPTIRALEKVGFLTKTQKKGSESSAENIPFLAPTLLSPHVAKSCTELNLTKCELTDLPDTIGFFYGLRKLNLTQNQLTFLPVQVGRLYSLTSFDCSRNQITHLPDEMVCLTHLERLIVHSNLLTALPDAVESFTNLIELNAYNNRILKMEPNLANFMHATKINLSANRMMQVIPESVSHWVNIKVLNIFDCRIIHLPTLSQMLNLEEFRAYENHLQKVPNFGPSLRTLKVLEIHKNSIREVPFGYFKAIPNIKRISLGVNMLESLPNDMQGSKLEYFLCDNNRLSSLPETIGYLPSLKILFVEANVLSSLPWSLMRNSTLTRVNLALNPKIAANPEFKPILDHLQRICKSSLRAEEGRYTPPSELDDVHTRPKPKTEAGKKRAKIARRHSMSL